MDDQNIAIKVHNVSKYFSPSAGQQTIKQIITRQFKKDKKNAHDGYWAVKNANFEVKKGEFFGIVGRNGSGKSTLLKMMAGVYTPTKGAIGINGKLVPFIELGVGFNAELSGRDNVFLNGALLGFGRQEMENMYDEIVEFAELQDHMDVKLKNFSSGMQVRLAFSIAIRSESDILLIDEVLAVGDAAFQQKCFDYFERLKNNNKTVVLVSHDMAAIKRFCSRAAFIKDGEVIHVGSSLDISDLYTEDNIRYDADKENVPTDSKINTSKAHTIKATAVLKNEKQPKLKVNFRTEYDGEVYIGLSLLKSGVTIGEITTDKARLLKSSGSLCFNLDTNYLNGGVYQLGGITLFKVSNHEVLAIDKNRVEFNIKKNDDRRGGAVFLNDGWIYE